MSKDKNVFIESAKLLRKYAEKSPAIVVAFSGGKDSLAVLDLCSRVFTKIVCYTMYLVPDLRIIQEQIALAQERYPGVQFVQYPHWLLFNLLSSGVYTSNYHKFDNMPEVGPFEVKSLVMLDTGIELIADGSKASDSIARRRTLANTKEVWQGKVVYPIEHWNKWDVLSYLALHKIPLPLSLGDATTGIDLAARSLAWIHDVYPDDFKKMEKLFPYCRAAIYRREWYGLDTPRFTSNGQRVDTGEPLAVNENPYKTRLASGEDHGQEEE